MSSAVRRISGASGCSVDKGVVKPKASPLLRALAHIWSGKSALRVVTLTTLFTAIHHLSNRRLLDPTPFHPMPLRGSERTMSGPVLVDRVPALVASSQIEEVLREVLAAEGYSVSPQRGHGETGVDILAEKGQTRYYIEAISHKSSPPARSKDFFEAFFRAVSRLDDGAEHCVVAVSHLTARGLPDRARQYRIACRRISEAFPELAIWTVNTETRSVARTTWLHWSDEVP
jgi:hypothetical protein